ncbi:putative transcriptional regulator, TetR family [Nocardia nova SH22a]|uniref:Putative transcriptional regulator, TetR family n=1 Tax=Nocardia nova SH22a TaxID=1415166 RepID=W5THJ5_9NOCA|nr:putative transcriptional regulator, TetR family [Nocardia nova SH22a]
MSIPDIARRADVHVTSIYRRWPTKEHLILDALLDYARGHMPAPDTGTVRSDLIAMAGLLVGNLQSPLGRAVSRSMAVADDNADLDESRVQFWQARFEAARTVIDRAVARGELASDADPALALEVLIAPLYFRALLTRQPVEEDFITRLVDLLLRGLGEAS